ncbi:MAG TPA: pyridoxal phosphate-dependent aminotransferase [Desulfobacteraceae bacterium]|nr:pyridoxal phosphate-dependent aminotransferase [Desulfobacteraceae bacterium]HPJ66245.1 pyridoxal phosphate-dependent aminotransferase [Desulfobacteraceae bacterium]
MPISRKIKSSIERSSWVRKMFEEGAIRKAKFGPENVFDFSLGNPNLDPPARFESVLKDLASSNSFGVHGYMPNAGFIETRQAVADFLCKRNGHSFSAGDIVMTVGAGGALNVVFKAILDPGDEVIIPSPYFVEYNFYLDNHGGVPKTVNTNPDFSLDLSAIEKAINPNTRAILINNPNNPTGRLYEKDDLMQLGELLRHHSELLGRTIFLISDEPYNKIIFNGSVCPSVFDTYEQSILVTSFSKDLSLAGERIGYIAVNPDILNKNIIMDALILCNRILGYVNAPALMQRLIPSFLNDSVDIADYERKRDRLSEGLKEAGYDFNMPGGTFYLFPKAPIPDDVEFVRALQEENILTVPGSAFGGPGHFRIAYCVDDRTIEGSLTGFARVMQKYK